MKSVVFLGSKPVGYRCFKDILERQADLQFSVAGLLTQSRQEFAGDHDLASLAAAYGVPVLTAPDALPACDVLYSVQYHKILTPGQLAKARLRAVNLHMAPLPEYRGANQFSYALLDGKTEFGTTIHLMDPRIDHGDILFQKRFPIPAGCWVADLYEQTVEASVALFRDTLGAVLGEELPGIPQAQLETQYGTALHFKNEMAQLKEIDLSWPADRIERQLRATYMPGFEPPYAWVAGRKVHLVPEQQS